MQIFSNPTGEGVLFFDNLTSATGVDVVYDPDTASFRTNAKQCANRKVIGCNWIANSAGGLCQSCAMTTLSPDTSIPGAVANWARAEAAKRWVIVNLRRWHWFGSDDSGPRPTFHMLAEGLNPVIMGHAAGVVTISIDEANPVLRAGRREALDERYRTMIGHVRHEIAHMIWWRLGINADFLEKFRSLFGDERSDYTRALERHYRDGPPSTWQAQFLTPYASAHPHEDWAETVAHLLHLVDIADSFHAVGHAMSDLPEPDWSAYDEQDAAKVVRVGAKIALGINHVNRSMGLEDLYPFVLSGLSRRKLEFVHTWIRQGVTLGSS